jgi:hypothetical protein
MSDIYIIILWYIPPMTVVFAATWWHTDVLCGDQWGRRFDLRYICSSVCVAALWPIFAFFICKRTYVFMRYMNFAVHLRQSRDDWMHKCLERPNTVECRKQHDTARPIAAIDGREKP